MDLQTTNKIILDLSSPCIQNIRCVQGDKDSRNINIIITNNRQPYPLDFENLEVLYKIRKPDGTGIYNEALINPDGTITICLSDQATACPGKAESELQFIDHTTKRILSTMKFNILIDESVLSNSKIESNFESDLIDEIRFHLEDKSNPHEVNKEQVGLGRVDNTPDIEKNVNSAIHDGNGNIIYTEILSEDKPMNQKDGDYWLKEYETPISSGYKKIERYVKTDNEYSKISHWTSSQTVEMDNGNTLEVTMNDEITRAKEAEKSNADAIIAEKDRASGAENILTDNLEAEITRATNAENLIQSVIDVNKPNWDDKYTKNEIDNKFSILESNIDWKEAVGTFNDIAIIYPNPDDGWTVNVKDTDYTYRWNGSEWITISANSIPKATQDIDGLLSKEDKTNYDDANSKKHTHDNKSILDKISQTLFDSWTAAYQHISDAVRHITGDERTLWNTVTDKVDKVAGKDLSANDYTDDDRNKLADIAAGAEVNQNTFSTVAVGSSAITADSKTDTLTFAAGANVTLTPDTTNHKITITAKDTAYTDMAGATADTAGSSGLVPAPAAGEQTGYLRGDGTWSAPTITKLGSATVGSGISPIYLSNGTATASSSTVGSAARPVYMNAGKITAGTYTLGTACAKGVTDSSAPGAISTGTNLPTERDIYYGLPTINGSHSYTSSTSIYAPTSAGISGYILQSNGSGAPSWSNSLSLNGSPISYWFNSSYGFCYETEDSPGDLCNIAFYDKYRECVSIGYNKTIINDDIIVGSHKLYPVKDNNITLGDESYRYKDIYCTNSVISTSDRNFKDNINPLSEKYEQLFMFLLPVSFTFKDGTSGRTHIGFIAQDVEEAMQKVGLTDLDFAGFCKDVKITCHLDEEGKEVEEPVLDEDGNPVYIYSLRYEEFIAINTHMIQKQQQEINSLKDDMELIKEQLRIIGN